MSESHPNGGGVAAPAAETVGLDPEKVLQALTHAWQQRATVGGEDALVRASTLNLLIYSPGPELAREVQDLLPVVVEKHPCRVIHIQAQPAATESVLRAWTEVHTVALGQGVRQLCCEQVTIDAQGDSVIGLEGAVMPLLDPELPVYLWWRGDPPFEGELFERLVETADCMVFDSADFGEPDEDLEWLADLVATQPFEIAYSDVNWARLTAWRALTAQFFDGIEYRDHLRRISSVRIGYAEPGARDGRVSAQAWLLLGWLASRLGWRVHTPPQRGEDGVTQLVLRSGENEVTVRFRCDDAVFAGLHGVTELHMEAGPQPVTHFRVELLPESGCARTLIACQDASCIERVVKMEETQAGLLIGREFAAPGRDALYEDALQAVVAMALHASPAE